MILRSSPVGLGFLDLSFRFIRASDAPAAMNGIPAADHIGRTPMELLPGLAPETYLPMFERALRGEPVSGVEVAGETPAHPGERRHWEESIYPLRAMSGTILGIGIVAIDITARKEAEQALREREQTLQLILESAPSAMLVVASDGRIVDLNGEAESLFAYQRTELVGRSIDVLIPTRYRDDHPGHRADLHQHPRTRAMGHGRDDLAGVRKGGAEFPAEVGLGVAPGRADLVTCVVTDVSPRRQAEADHAALLAAERHRGNASPACSSSSMPAWRNSRSTTGSTSCSAGCATRSAARWRPSS